MFAVAYLFSNRSTFYKFMFYKSSPVQSSPYVTSVLVIRSCYASGVIILESSGDHTVRKAKLSRRGTKNDYLFLPVDTTSVITPTIITVCGFHQLIGSFRSRTRQLSERGDRAMAWIENGVVSAGKISFSSPTRRE